MSYLSYDFMTIVYYSIAGFFCVDLIRAHVQKRKN